MTESASPVIAPVASTSRPAPQLFPPSRDSHQVGKPSLARAALTIAVPFGATAIPGSPKEATSPPVAGGSTRVFQANGAASDAVRVAPSAPMGPARPNEQS